MPNILFIGDIVGRVGREMVAQVLPAWKREHEVHLTIANVENCAHGKGITREALGEIFAAGVDVATSGNHVWNFHEAFELLEETALPLLRPANFSPKLPGSGARLVNAGPWRVLVVNLMGQVGMHQHLDSPFDAVDRILEEHAIPGRRNDVTGDERVHAIVVDWHAEATSEKLALGWYLDGRVSAVLGTHTHVPTADERLLPKGTAYQSDVGMAGAYDSILGVEVEPNLRRFTLQVPERLAVEERYPGIIGASLVAIDAQTGLATGITRLSRVVENETLRK